MNSNQNIIVNKSDYILNMDETTLLGYGLSFSIKNPDPWLEFHNNFKYWQRKQNNNSETNSDILFGVLLQLMLNNLKGLHILDVSMLL